MNPPPHTQFRMTETWWRVTILALSGAVILFSIWCLTNGITTIFMHLYYFPIVLLAYRYRWKGFGLATLLSVAYLGLVILFDAGQMDVIIGAVYRVMVFAGIAAVIAYLSGRLAIEKRSAQESSEIKERYISLAPAIILVLDRNGTVTYLNEKGGKILESTPGDVTGKSWFDHFLPEHDRDRVKRLFSKMVTGGILPDKPFENPVLTRSGTERIIRWNNTVLRNEEGQISGILGFGEDITEEKRAQDTLRKMQQFQESVIANANVWISVLAPDGSTILVWNDAAEAISGYKKSDVAGKNAIWKQLYPDKDYRRKITGEIQRIISKDDFLENFETAIRCADGTKKTIVWNTRALKDTGGKVTGYIAIGRDVSAEKAAESALQESESFNRGLVENLPDYIAVYGMDGKLLYVNPASARTLGYDADKMVGTHVLSYIAKEFHDTVKAKMAARLVAGNVSPYEIDMVTKNGPRRSVIVKATPIQYHNNPAILLLLIDITGRKSAEQALRDSEQKYRAFFTTSRDCVFITTLDGSWVDFNDAAVDLFGYDSRESLLKTKVSGIYATASERDAHIRYIRENGYSFEYPVDLMKKDGTIINTLITTVARKDAAGNIIGFQGSIRDITEQKVIRDRMQNLLRLQEEQVRIINTSPAIAFLWRAEANWPVETVSGNISNFGYTVDDFVSGRVVYNSIIHPDDLGKVAAEVESNSKNHIDDFRQIYRIFGKDGSEYWIDDFTHIRRDNEGTITHYEGLILDISDRRRAEDALALEKQRMESLLSLSLMGQKPDPEIIAEVVEDAIRLTGSTIGYLATLNEDESVMTMQYWSKSAHESCTIVDKPIVYAVEKTGLWGEAVRQRKPIVTNDYPADSPFKHGTPGGHVPLVRHMNIPVFDGDHIVAVAGVGNKNVDYNEGDVRQLQLLMQGWWQVTVRKRAEEALWESREHYRALIDYSQLAIAVLDVNHRIIMVNPRFSILFKKPAGEFVGKYCFSEFEKRTAVCTHCPGVRAMVTRKPEETETEGVLDDGTRFSARIRAVPFFGPDGVVKGFVEMVEDITDRKRAEEAIARSEERYRTLAEASPDQIFISDRSGTIVYANTMALKLFGLPPDQVVGKQRKDLFPPDLLMDQDTTFEEVFVSGAPVRREARIRFGEQEQWIDTNLVPLKDTAGHVTAVLGVARDITGRKQIEEALRESRQLFSDIISFLPDPTFVIDKNGIVLAWNRAIEQLSGAQAGDIIGKGDHEYSLWLSGKRRPILIDLVLHPDQDAGRMDYTGIHWEGRTVTAQTVVSHPGSGKDITLSLVASPLIDAQGKITGAIESIRDISPLKETEAELARINQSLEQIVRDRTRALEEEVAQRLRAEQEVQGALEYTRSVIEANPDLMVVLDQKGILLDVNAVTESMTGIPREQLIGSSYSLYLMDDSTPRDVFAQLLEKGRIEYTIRLRRVDGHITPLSVNTTLFRGKGTTDTRIIVAAHDITRQMNDEAVIRAALDEQVLLLREVHHRVNNNLQIIISLTNLQMRQTNDPVVKQIMSETQNRVRAMSLVHEKLYRSASLSHIDFADYTRFLATQLFSFYGMDTRNVAIEFSLENIMVDIVTAVPLGLLMNELISNALRHAFPQGRQGTITISGKDDGSLITLVVRDNGIGIPEDFDWKNTRSLGMRLITSLVDQIDGTITLDRQNGTAFTILVKRPPSPGGKE